MVNSPLQASVRGGITKAGSALLSPTGSFVSTAAHGLQTRRGHSSRVQLSVPSHTSALFNERPLFNFTPTSTAQLKSTLSVLPDQHSIAKKNFDAQAQAKRAAFNSFARARTRGNAAAPQDITQAQEKALESVATPEAPTVVAQPTKAAKSQQSKPRKKINRPKFPAALHAAAIAQGPRDLGQVRHDSTKVEAAQAPAIAAPSKSASKQSIRRARPLVDLAPAPTSTFAHASADIAQTSVPTIHRMGRSIDPFAMPARPQELPSRFASTALIPANNRSQTPRLAAPTDYNAYKNAIESEARFAQLAGRANPNLQNYNALTVIPANTAMIPHQASRSALTPAYIANEHQDNFEKFSEELSMVSYQGKAKKEKHSGPLLSLRQKAMIAAATGAALYALTRNNEIDAQAYKAFNDMFAVFEYALKGLLVGKNALMLPGQEQKELIDNQSQQLMTPTQQELAVVLKTMQEEAAKYGLVPFIEDAELLDMQFDENNMQIIRINDLQSSQGQALIPYQDDNANNNDVAAMLKKVMINGRFFVAGFINPKIFTSLQQSQSIMPQAQIARAGLAHHNAAALVQANPTRSLNIQANNDRSIVDRILSNVQQSAKGKKISLSGRGLLRTRAPHASNVVMYDPIVHVVKKDGNKLLNLMRREVKLVCEKSYPKIIKSMINGHNHLLRLTKESPLNNNFRSNLNQCKRVFIKLVEDIQQKYGFNNLA